MHDNGYTPPATLPPYIQMHERYPAPPPQNKITDGRYPTVRPHVLPGNRTRTSVVGPSRVVGKERHSEHERGATFHVVSKLKEGLCVWFFHESNG